MGKSRESFESKVVSYFNTCNEDVGTVLFGMVASVARKRGLTGRHVAKAGRKARVAKPNGAGLTAAPPVIENVNISHHGA